MSKDILGHGEQPNTQKENQSVECGVGGYNVSGGYIMDDFLNELNGHQGRKKYREMSENDATIGGLLNAIELILRSANFDVVPAEQDVENAYSEFVERNMYGVKGGWDNVLSEVMTSLVYGFSLLEMVFERDESGYITTAKLSPRAQETVLEWDIDEYGDLQGVKQTPPNGWASIYIPYEKLLHFKTKENKGNPEGFSLLRRAYRSYHFLKNIEMIEAIAIERELAGLPVMYIPAAAMKNAEVRAKYEQLVRDVKKNSQGGVVLPSDMYKDADGNPTQSQQYRLELLSASGSRSIDTDTVIKRHQHNIVRTALADFLMLGSSDTGSFALSKSKTDLFILSIQVYLEMICQELNAKWLGTLWELNGFDSALMPEIKASKVAPEDLKELGAFLRDIGFVVDDQKTENYLREISGMPIIEEDNIDE